MYAEIAETALLQIAIQTPHVVDEVGLSPDMFSPVNRRAWELLQQASKNRRTVTEQDFSGFNQAYREKIFKPLNMPVGVATQYADQIRVMAIPRSIDELGRELQRIASDGQMPPMEKEAKAHNLLMTHFGKGSAIKKRESLVSRLTAQFQDLLKNGIRRGMVTGLKTLDKELVIRKKGIYVFAGDSGIGKTQFMIQIIHKNPGKRVFYMSVEVDEEDIAKRMAATWSLFNPEWYVQKGLKISDQMIAKYYESLGRYAKTYETDVQDPELYVQYTSVYEEFEAEFLARHFRNPYDCLIIDHINDLNFRVPIMNEYQRVNEIARRLKDLSERLKIPVLLLVQLNRQNTSEKPSMYRLRFMNPDIPYAATFIYKDPNLQKSDDGVLPLLLFIDKNRYGEGGIDIPIQFHGRDGGVYRERGVA